jgi:hemerythrin
VIYFDWNPAFDTGIPGIDYEHHQLVNMLNEIHHLIVERADSQKISDALAQFHRLASAHFALEEKIMQDRKYPGLKGRRQTHYRLLDQVREIMDAFDAGDHRLEDLPVTLRAWLAEAMEIDTKLFVEINEAGLRRWGLSRSRAMPS